MAVDYGIGEASVEEIDKLGIQAATYLAYSRAIDQLKMVDYLLIDGMKWHDCPLPCQAIIKGDSISSSIAAASIIAKVYRDSLMDKLHIELPCYGFDKHKGYGTKFHAESLKMNGISAHHRRSYSPIKQYI